jgi:hypothetical protein
LEISSASPRAATSIARVAMKATTLPYAMTTPLMSPARAPVAIATIAISPHQLCVDASCTAEMVATMEERPISEPTDRSMPPAMITNVMPTLITPRTDP